MRIMKVSARPGIEGVARARGGIFELPEGLSDGEIVTVCSPVDHGYLQVQNSRGEVFTATMQEIDCGTLYEVSGWFLPPYDERVRTDVTKQRSLGFRHDGFEVQEARIGRLRNPRSRPYRECHGQPPPDIFEQLRRSR
jgi:hypothetical protein